jgi:hypothetical protein
MKLFKCHAVMPLLGHERTHVVKTYVVAAENWEWARTRVRGEEPGAEFVTVPVETPSALQVEIGSMSEREFADLRSACDWREQQAQRAADAMPCARPIAAGSKG